ncbi:MAG TPA: toxin-antitoxin system antitoxin subunit [Sorangium sp.]|nr:toxin-antitoxin system antitoxin subunit [Sorangium sp.]
MTTAKIAVSLPFGLLTRVRRAVARGEAASVSAYVAAALTHKTKLDDLSQLLGEMLNETGGALTDDERRQADKKLGVTPPSRRKGA